MVEVHDEGTETASKTRDRWEKEEWRGGDIVKEA
jgi:hypothetical protein